MRVYISFYEAANYTFENPENKEIFDNIEALYRIGGELKSILQEYYFNGADNAVNLIGVSRDKLLFEFELIPN